MKIYYPYPSDKPEKKYYIITKDNKRVYFGAAGYSDFTQHKDEARKQRYIKRHEKNESKFGINPGLIRLVFGLYICFGINQALNKVMRILKNDFYKKYL
jgi:hypothetical protein